MVALNIGSRIAPGLVLALGGLGCGSSEAPQRESWPTRELGFPTRAELDYRPRPALAHAALPRFDVGRGRFEGPGRMWLKGSPGVDSAAVDGGPAVELAPPFYVALVEAASGPATVRFEGAAGRHEARVLVPDAEELNAPREHYSLLAFSCFDPFTVYAGEARVNAGDGTDAPGAKAGRRSRLVEIRALLRDAARGAFEGLPAPELVCGASDQVYVEAGHDAFAEWGPVHPLSAWTVEARPRPRVSLGGFRCFLDEAYRATWSFETLDEVLRAVPAVMTWDDHEIRDGWGSQGDEHVYLDSYYAAAREAFVQHQLARGPREGSEELAAPHASLHQQLRLHGLPVFVMDQRSARDVRVPRVMGADQWAAFEAWIAALDPAESPAYVIVSPLPLLYRLSNLVELAEGFQDEIRDDLLDAWSSEPNEPELDRILAQMLAAWRRGCRGVVLSGDMHLSGMLSATVSDPRTGREGVLAYEIVVSGLAGELGGGDWKFHVAREGLVLPEPVEVDGARLSMSLGLAESSPNFGGLEVDGGELFAHVVQSLEEGPVHYRVPLTWGAGEGGLGERLERARRELDPRAPAPGSGAAAEPSEAGAR